jgi:hypothetical protein
MPRSPNPIEWTNATKAQVLAALAAFLGLLQVFGVPLTADMIGAILTFAGTVAVLFVQFTYRKSPTSIDNPTARLAAFNREINRYEAAGGHVTFEAPPPQEIIRPAPPRDDKPHDGHPIYTFAALALLIAGALAFAPEAHAEEDLEPVPAASIIVELDAPGAGDANFVFEVGDVAFVLEDGDEYGLDVEPGSYLIVQTPRDGYELVEVDCGSADVQDAGLEDYDVRVAIEEGDEVRCIFTNAEAAPAPTSTPEPAPTATPEPTAPVFDLCLNIDGVQSVVPDGLEWRVADWHCVTPAPATPTPEPPNVTITPPNTGSGGIR